MNRLAMMGQPADRNTTESANSSAATDDSTAETASIDTQGNMGTTPQGGPNVFGTQGEMPSGGGFQGRDSFAGKFIDFYAGAWLHHHNLCHWRLWISHIGDIQKNSCLKSQYYLRKEKVPIEGEPSFLIHESHYCH
ncbi:hypothetical protein [Peribacillus simplex]|uniref:hypothetical protein n=1 Tax=Peribacillus simplex TaxID=1478 RepID=UPI0024C19972|nr:hypothetical protein [Peribacillus simplex]MDR4928889.1 hypothetical protein [Peribacillus simplex]WHX91318.1 hypothetical protein QNH50_25850 [Peribacillus simplex]